MLELTTRTHRDMLARVALHPAEDADGGTTPHAPLLTEALFVASRHVASADGEPSESMSRGALTRRAYTLRARWRTISHGAFVGVAPGDFAQRGNEPVLRLGHRHRARSNPSPAWLTALSERALEQPEVFAVLRFTAAPDAVRRGTRLEHEWRMRRVTVRATDAVMLIMDVSARGATLREVLTAVDDRWPHVPATTVINTLKDLIRAGFVFTDLLPDDVSNDPLGHLLEHLPTNHPAHEPVRRLRQTLERADRHPVGDPIRLAALADAQKAADDVQVHERPLTVDVVADATVNVPAELRAEAERAASVLWRITPPSDSLYRFRERFIDHYGTGRAVPLLDATDATIGIDLAHDTGDDGASASPARSADRMARRSRRLGKLLNDTLFHGHVEVVLDDATIAELGATGEPDDVPPPTSELGAQVIAASAHDRAAGRLMLAVTSCCSPAGATSGRFARLVPGTAPVTGGTEPSEEMVAEIVVRPRSPEGATLAPATGRTAWRIPVGVPSRPGDLDLNDLRLVAIGERLRLWSSQHDRPVRPELRTRLADRLLPPLAAFLDRLGRDGCRPLTGWSWGPFREAPFQPRVRYRRTILAPARWLLPATLTRAVHSPTAWANAVAAWRATTMPPLPDVIVTDHADQRLPLDLRRPDDRELLRRYVGRGLTAICEPPGGPNAVQAVVTSPLGRHVLELIVPLERRAGPRPFSGPVAAIQRAPETGRFLPGSSWLSLAIRTPAPCQDEILRALPSLTDRLGEYVDTWFWLRYDTPTYGPHLRIRFHGQPAELGAHVLPAISAWSTDLTRQRLSAGFSIEPYDQEIERYGGPDAIAAAERVFATDSRLVIDILTTTSDSDQRVIAAAMSAAAIADQVADRDPAALTGRHLDRDTRQRFTAMRAHTRDLWIRETTTSRSWPADGDWWTARSEALLAYQDAVKPTLRTACASSIIHMHANRLLGDHNAERLTRALAADLLAYTGSWT